MKKFVLMSLLAAVVAFGQADNARQRSNGPKSQAKVLTRAEIDDLLVLVTEEAGKRYALRNHVWLS